MTKTTLPTHYIYHDTDKGRLPFTLFVFGPYSPYSTPEWDVEIYRTHITDEERMGHNYMGTVSGLKRDSHIVSDIWDWMNENV